MDAVGTAHLTSDILPQRAVGASVSRRQITDVLKEPEGAPELVLDLVAAEGGEHATISMTWSREDLEQLLESASGDEMVLVFDRDELASASARSRPTDRGRAPRYSPSLRRVRSAAARRSRTRRS